MKRSKRSRRNSNIASAVKALKHPWDGLTELERQGLLLADMAKGGAINLPALLDVLEAGRDRTSTFSKPIPLPTQFHA